MHIPKQFPQNPVQKKFFAYSYLFGIFLLAASLPYSKFLMSLSLIILFLSWIFEGDLLRKIELFRKNRTAMILSSLFILPLIGLLYTSDFRYGLEDVKKKIPLMLLPLILSTSTPLSKKMFENIISVFVLSVIISTLICFYVLLGYTSRQILQPQHASIFISHIRFGLLISLSISILGYFFITKNSMFLKITIPPLIVWLGMFLIMMESATGVICTVVVCTVMFFRWILQTKKMTVKLSLLTIFILGCSAVMSFFYFTIKKNDPISNTNYTHLPLLTKKGNPYIHDTINHEIENGNYVWLNVCETELAEEWNKNSSLEYYGKDLRGNELKYTIIRFLTSKGLLKDAEGINALSPKELKAIEKGIPNVSFTSVFNPSARVQKIIWEFDMYLKGGNPSGHSVVQRFEFWKASIGIIKENLWFGVGTGDVKNAFAEHYEKINSPLTKKWRLRSHNQFLAMGTAFGIIGMGWFLITLFYPIVAERKFNDFFYLTFFIIAFLSMFTEDTLESQAGVTFFAFFNSFFLFLKKEVT